MFSKTGIIKENRFIKLSFEKVEEITVEYDALVIPASKGIGYIKEIRRKNPLKPIVVINGDHTFIDAGADKYTRRINKDIIAEMTHLNKVIQNMWSRTETDNLTGLYTRAFMNEWMQNREERSKGYVVAMLDIDKFKKINDTYGHDVGDVVLSIFGEVLKSEVRQGDIVARYGGEEFVICMPDTTLSDGYVLIDRLRNKWSERVILSNEETIKSTFSAGVAEWKPGINVLKTADEMLYRAKNSGRNRVEVNESKARVLLLGEIPAIEFHSNNIEITFDPDQADIVVADRSTYNLAHDYISSGIPLYILGSGGISDWVIKKNINAEIFPTIQEIVGHIKGRNKVQIIPEKKRSALNIPLHGALYVICPSRPAAASELAVKIGYSVSNIGFVCASGSSVAAKILGIPDRVLIEADWRLVGSTAPLEWEGMKVWPVDPHKHIITKYDVHKLVDQIKNYFDAVIVDCAGNLDLCQRVAHDEGILLLYREGDMSDVVTANWATTFKQQNLMVISPSEDPGITEEKEGLQIAAKKLI